MQSYLAFMFPIKRDPYGHSYLRHVVDRLAADIHLANSRFKFRNSEMKIENIDQIIRETRQRYGVELCLVGAIVNYEPAYNPNAVSTTGAMSVMALQPATTKRFGVTDRFDPQNNIDGGTRLILELLTQLQGNIALTVAGHNARDIAVRKYNGVPAYRETTDYVKYVSRIYDACKQQGEKQ